MGDQGDAIDIRGPAKDSSGSVAALFFHIRLTAAFAPEADYSTARFQAPGLKRLLSPLGDV